MKSFVRCLVALLHISPCVSFGVPRNLTEKNDIYRRQNGTNDEKPPKEGSKDTAPIPPDNGLDRIKNLISAQIGVGQDPYKNIATHPSFIQGNESYSCYPPEYFSKTPNWWGKGDPPFPANTAFHTNDKGCNEWARCSVTAGGVGILYFPTGSDAVSYSTNYYDTGMQYMFESPTVYLVFQTVWGWATDSNLPTGAPRPTQFPASNPAPWPTSLPMLEPAAPQNPLPTQDSIYIDRLSSLREEFKWSSQLPASPPQSQAPEAPGNPAQSQAFGTPQQSQAPGAPGQSQDPGTPQQSQAPKKPEEGLVVIPTELTATSTDPISVVQSPSPTQNKRDASDLEQDSGSIWAMPVGGSGQLGPTIANKFFAFKLDEVSTLHPYPNTHAQGNMVPRQLQLSDLYSDCPETADYSSLSSQSHPVIGDRGYRCFPRFKIPDQLLEGGKPWWNKCRVLDIEMGLVDPPIAFKVAKRSLVPPTPAEPETGNGNHPPPRPIPQDGLPSKTVSLEQSPSSTDPVHIPPPKPDDTPGPPNLEGSSSSPPTGYVENPEILPENQISDQPPVQVSSDPLNGPGSETPSQISPGQEVGGGIVSISPVINSDGETLAPAVVLPGGSTLLPGNDAVTLPASDGSGKSVYVSVATSVENQKDAENRNQQEGGLLVLSTLGAASAKICNIVGHPGKTATQGCDVHAFLVDKATAVYLGATLVQGGEIRTASNAVLSYGSSGVVVQYPGGAVSTYLPSLRPPSRLPNHEPVEIKGVATDGMRVGTNNQNLNSLQFIPAYPSTIRASNSVGMKSQDIVFPQTMVESTSTSKGSNLASGKGGTYSKQITTSAFISTSTIRNNAPGQTVATSSKKKNDGENLSNKRSLRLMIVFIFLGVYLKIS